MLIAIVLDRLLEKAKALVEASNVFIKAITRIMQTEVIAQMISPATFTMAARSSQALHLPRFNF